MIDQLDNETLALLQEDGRRPFTEIAKNLGVTEGTVRKRAARLIDEDVVRVIGLVDPHKVGFDAPAIIHVTVIPPTSGRKPVPCIMFPRNKAESDWQNSVFYYLCEAL